ncbi:hypothetical protein [Nocardiopsis metallicus]|uniref:Uncharacterized protein n=1 Tax=Nocardiopsis metallicus TaxID=179819 RepID=A0A840WX63_9ACTN|nr:hypothetical protein [Nocardiopsis metallicus]MBB5494768.1 hypothetical protein [Nocardiopsis metallicus]
MSHHVFEHHVLAPTLDSPDEVAATTRALLARWGVRTEVALLMIARVRTLATLLTACAAHEFHLRLLNEDGQVRAQVTTPTGVLNHDLPTWQVHPAHPNTLYITSAAVQDQPLGEGASCRQHALAPQERRSA